MNLLFLDIDGVMNSANGEPPYLADMEISKLILLKRILVDFNIDGVVITSDRRTSKIYMDELEKVFDQFEIMLLGTLRYPKELDEDCDDNRGKQIEDYLNSSNYNIEKIVILDDNDEGISSLFKDELILINRFEGISEDTVNKIKKVLED